MGNTFNAMATLAEFKAQWFAGNDFIEAHTSGSTGEPKAIRLPKSDMISSARATNQFFGITKASVLGLPLSIDYIAGKMMAVRSFEAGCSLLLLPVSNRFIIDETIDLLSVVPSQLECLLKQERAPKLVRNLLIGGAPLSDELRKRVIAAGFNGYLGYGMTETCSHVALQRLDANEVYTAMPQVEFTTDSRNCLVVRSERFTWKELTTNDVVELISSTQFRWLGRADHVINSGGVKIHPEQIENIIRRELPQLPPFYLVGKAHPQLGSEVVMVIECGAEEAEIAMHQIAGLQLPRYSHPRQAIAVDDLPRTSNGKVRRLLPPDNQ